ncbi:hypothetical protein MIMGU_mgv11b013738mg [Erythranthe guttata]|uniref:Uncharacterized protein n=1 Tax=Erythranthe guttata TaxID=4155 RepID=A0A022Q078_ERYGU|nr:hypothetical protein MIMGU_mgv11b013738mg [Erythranthe guttata]
MTPHKKKSIGQLCKHKGRQRVVIRIIVHIIARHHLPIQSWRARVLKIPALKVVALGRAEQLLPRSGGGGGCSINQPAEHQRRHYYFLKISRGKKKIEVENNQNLTTINGKIHQQSMANLSTV